MWNIFNVYEKFLGILFGRRLGIFSLEIRNRNAASPLSTLLFYNTRNITVRPIKMNKTTAMMPKYNFSHLIITYLILNGTLPPS